MKKSHEDVWDYIGYQPSWLGCLRIFIWSVLFLILAGSILPEHKMVIPFEDNVQALSITPMITLPSDPMFIRKKDSIVHQDKKPKIAWISDSSSVLYKPGAKFLDFSKMAENELLPVKVLTYLNVNGFPNAQMDLYLRLSLRSLEAYTLTIAALEQKPDMVVLTLNPFFVFNDHAIFKGKSHFPRASKIWSGHWENGALILLFCAPRDHFWNLIISKFNIFTKAPAYAQDIAKQKHKLWYAVFPELNGLLNQTEITQHSEEKLKENALIFWVVQRQLKGDIRPLVNEKNEAINAIWYRQLIRLSALNDISWNSVLLDMILQAIQQSGVKAVLYLAPVSQELHQDITAWERYEKIKEKLNEIAKRYGDENINIITNIPNEVLKDAVFVKDDGVHMQAEGDLDIFLARQIAKATSSQGKQ